MPCYVAGMKFQIWMVLSERDEYPVYTEALTPTESEALERLGYRLEHEYEAVNKEIAEAYFVGWCDNMAGVDDEREGAQKPGSD